MAGVGQLRLPFEDTLRYEAADFVAAESNEAAMSWLGRDDWPDRRLAIWGPEGCGKTHLLHVWAGRRQASILDGRALAGMPDLPMAGGVAVDDADRIADEEALLHLLNTARDRGLFVLLGARPAPARWAVSLPDLSSRLRAVNAVEIAAPDDGLLEALVIRAMAQRQLEVPANLAPYMVRHWTRSAAGILEAVRRLDEASLAQGRAITRRFAAEVLGLKSSADG
jgi:chromosomal replication initiation ATPase DnaA